MPLELRHYSDLPRHIKEPQSGIYCLNFLKMFTIWNQRPCFISEVTFTVTVLSVGVSSVPSLLRYIQYIWTDLWIAESSNSNEGVFAKGIFWKKTIYFPQKVRCKQAIISNFLIKVVCALFKQCEKAKWKPQWDVVNVPSRGLYWGNEPDS